MVWVCIMCVGVRCEGSYEKRWVWCGCGVGVRCEGSYEKRWVWCVG